MFVVVKRIFVPTDERGRRESTTVMNNDNENEDMEEEFGEAEAAAVAQGVQVVVGEDAAHVAV